MEAYSDREKNTTILLITGCITGMLLSHELGLKWNDEIKFVRWRIIGNKCEVIKAH